MARSRAGERSLNQLLATACRAMCAIDGQHQLVYCNPALGELLGVKPDALLGRRCAYHVPEGEGDEVAGIAASLAPPPDAWQGSVSSAVVNVQLKSGVWQPCRAEFLLLGEDALAGGGLLVTLTPCAAPATPASEAASLHAELARLHRELWAHWPLEELVGVSPEIQRVRDQLALAARGAVRVLIQGATGSGREHAARLLYRRSQPSGSEPLIPLWCPLLDAELIQSTITAMARQWGLGSAPADDERPGGVRGPTLLLLEVDQLEREAQAELAGFLTLPTFECYTIATTETSLIQLAAADQYRRDLAFALSTLVIEVPPLAGRREDIPLLSQYFVEKYNSQGQRQVSGLTSEALDALALYSWPENIDELATVVAHSCRAAEGGWIEPRHLPDTIRWAQQALAHPPRVDEPVELDAVLEEVERELLVRALRRAKGNKTKAAHLLGVSRARFHRRWEFFERLPRGDAGKSGHA